MSLLIVLGFFRACLPVDDRDLELGNCANYRTYGNKQFADVASYRAAHARPTLISHSVDDNGPSILLMIRAASSLEMG